MDSYRLTPVELSENPALGILTIVMEGLSVARLALWAAHAELPDDEFIPEAAEEAAAGAYAFAILSEIDALQGTIQSYRLCIKRLRRRREEAQDGEEPLDETSLF